MENKKPLHLLNYSTTDTISLDKRCINIYKEFYDGMIACLEVEDNSNFYVIDQGKTFWTHNSSVVALANASHRVIEMRWDGNAIVGSIEIFCDRGEIPGTPSGNILKSLLLNGVKLGISSRGVGSVKEANEGSVVQDDFELIAFDFVSNPSTKGAFMKVGQMNESVEYNTNKYERINSLINKIIYK
jgi:hypothetical protein